MHKMGNQNEPQASTSTGMLNYEDHRILHEKCEYCLKICKLEKKIKECQALIQTTINESKQAQIIANNDFRIIRENLKMITRASPSNKYRW